MFLKSMLLLVAILVLTPPPAFCAAGEPLAVAAPEPEVASAAPLIYYVWYKQNGRYTGEGPYTRSDAYKVADDRRREGYSGVYIGDKKGKRMD